MNTATAAIIATTAAETFVPAGPFIVTECPDHGIKECADRPSFANYVTVARQCHNVADDLHREIAHPAGISCWSCCDKMVVDPDDVLS